MSAAVSPDRRSIAIDLLGSLWVLPIRGGEAKRITPELLEARQPTWSPDSQSIAFQGYEDGTWHIYVINRDGGDARAVTHGEFDDREPGVVARRVADRVLVRPLWRHLDDLGGRPRQRRAAARDDTRRLDAGLVAERRRDCVRLPGSGAQRPDGHPRQRARLVGGERPGA